jgi:hypothetical protein
VSLTDSVAIVEGCWENSSTPQHYGHVIFLKISLNNTETLRVIISAEK